MTTEPLAIERDGHVETWTIDRPDRRNPITDDDMVDAFCAATSRVNRDAEVRAVILTGAGPAFSAGGDVKAMARRSGMFGGSPYQQRQGYRHGVQRLTMAMYGCEVPIVAAVNGAAVGAGCDLALMCDVRVAATDAFFAESFVKLGIIPGDGGAWLLPRIVGAARAAEMTLTGDRVEADRALAWGLVSAVVSKDTLIKEARGVADRIAVNPPHAVRMAKRLLQESQHQRLESLLDMSASMQALAHHTDDHVEAMRAMVEKRVGDFHGR